jgi:hypothetical protein
VLKQLLKQLQPDMASQYSVNKISQELLSQMQAGEFLMGMLKDLFRVFDPKLIHRPSMAEAPAQEVYTFGKELYDAVRHMMEILKLLVTGHAANSAAMGKPQIEFLLSCHIYEEGGKQRAHLFGAADTINAVYEDMPLGAEPAVMERLWYFAAKTFDSPSIKILSTCLTGPGDDWARPMVRNQKELIKIVMDSRLAQEVFKVDYLEVSSTHLLWRVAVVRTIRSYRTLSRRQRLQTRQEFCALRIWWTLSQPKKSTCSTWT